MTLQPVVKNQLFNGPYVLDRSWVVITPATADVPAGGSAKFTVKALVPTDALRVSYNSLIVFTDEQYPSPYLTPFPNYIHQMNLGVNVVSPPVVQIATPYLSDQIEAGKEYRYTVEIKNTGSTAVQLNPKIGSDNYPMYGPSGIQEPALAESAFSLNAPGVIQPGTSGTMNVAVNVPAAASGYYNGYIDLGIDDPSLMEGEGRVRLTFNIWKQPPEPFIKKFTLDAADPISIELTSGISAYMSPLTAGTIGAMPVREPTFDALLTGPEGNVAIHPVQKVIRGSVSLGSDPMVVASPQTGTYLEVNTQYIVTYTAQGKPGAWQLSVMPKNAQTFDYKITLGAPDALVLPVNKNPAPAAVSGPAAPEQNATATPAQAAVTGTT